jgi:hypothetical protein
MGVLVADDAVVGIAERRQAERVGGSPVEDEEDLAVDLEQLAK